MKTRELLAASEAELVAQLKGMKIKELERHAQKLLTQHGQPDYDAVMRSAIRAVPELTPSEQNRFQAMQNIVRSHLPLASNDDQGDNHAIERIAVILMVIIRKKFQKIHNEKR